MEQSVTLSPLILGTMRFGVWGAHLDATAQLGLIDAAVDAGMTTIDLADIYGDYTSEAEVGRALSLDPSLRSRLEIVTKCGIRMLSDARPQHRIKHYDSSRTHIVASAEQSLKALRTDYLDLLLLHRPDVLMHPDEVAEAFTALLQAGKVRAFGVSNYTPSQFALLHARFPLITNQVEASPLHLDPFQDGTFDQALDLDLPPMVWSPFAGGRLFQESEDEDVQRLQETVRALAAAHDAEPADVYLAWLLRHPAGLKPVIGTTRIDRIHTAMQSLDLTLSAEEWYMIWTAATGHDVP